MAHRGRRNADDLLAVELAAGKTLRDAAAAAGIAERTATRRWADPEFRVLVFQRRGDMVGRAVGELTDGMTTAAKTLRELLTCDSLAVRLGAARSLLEIGVRLRESLELEERVRMLEESENNDDEGDDD